MPSTLLQVVNSFQRRQSLPVAPNVIGNTDPAVVQIKELLSDLRDRIVGESDWETLKYICNFVSVNAEDQGDLSTLGGQDLTSLRSIIDNTIWDLTQRLPIYGPQSEAAYQRARALVSGGSFLRHRIEGGHLWIWPKPPAGHNMSFYWMSDRWMLSAADGATKLTDPLSDNDTFLIDDRLVKLGLRYLWLEAKGLPYQDAERAFRNMLTDTSTTGQTHAKLSMDSYGGGSGVAPGILIPTGAYIPQ